MENEQFKLIDVIERTCTEKNVRLEPTRVARDIMNTDVKTLTLDHTVKDCLKLMENSGIRHVPVVDLPIEEEQKLCFVGVVSQRDVLRVSTPDTEGIFEHKIDKKAMQQRLVNIVTRRPRSVSLETPAQELITAMISKHIDMVPVLDGADLAGIITTTDLMKLLSTLSKTALQLCSKSEKDTSSIDTASESSAQTKALSSWASRTVREIMSQPVICLEPRDNLGKAIRTLQTNKIRHIIIMDEHGKFMGVVSDRDILKNLPFTGKRRTLPPKKFREHLFATDINTQNLHLPLDKIMVQEVSHILPGCSVCEAAGIVYNNHISCLPVFSDQQKLEGIVTVIDLMKALLAVYKPVEEGALITS